MLVVLFHGSDNSKPQLHITTEAEIVAAYVTVRLIVWCKRCLEKIEVIKKFPELQSEDEAAINLAQNHKYHPRTKHTHMHLFFVIEPVTSADIKARQISTKYQVADIITKPLHKFRLIMLFIL